MAKGLGSLISEHHHPVIWVVNAASFLGADLCRNLLKKGAKIIAIDNWQVGIKENLLPLQDKNLNILEQDLAQNFPTNLPLPNYIFYLERVGPETADLYFLLLQEQHKVIERLLEIADQAHAKFLFASSEQNKSEKLREVNQFYKTFVLEYGKNRQVDVRLVELGNLYGPTMPLFLDDPLGNIIHQTLLSSPLAYAAGHQKVLPLFLDDAVSGIILAMFSPNSRGKTFSFAVREISISVFYDTVRSVSQQGIGSHSFSDADESWGGELLPVHTPLVLGISQTLQYFRENVSKITPKIRETKSQRPKTKDLSAGKASHKPIPKGWKWAIWLGLILIFFWFIGLPFLSFTGGGVMLAMAKKSFAAGNFNEASRWANFSKQSLVVADSSLGNLMIIPGMGESLLPARNQVRSLEEVADIAVRGAKIAGLGQKIFTGVIGGDSGTEEQIVNSFVLEVDSLSRDLSLSAAEKNDFLRQNFPVDFTTITKLTTLVKETPDLLGFKGKRQYLLLLQNNMELRPTGGFIGSIGLLTIDHGKLINIDIQDVYEADGHLSGHVEPPPALKTHLGEANWYLRDSNWDPDFPTTGQRAAWFLDKELNQQVDGVVALDLETVKKLIGIVGSLDIADFNTKINESNFYEKTQFFAQEEFFPGSTRKRDFLTATTRILIDRLKTSQTKIVSIGKVIMDNLAGRHLSIYLNNRKQQAILAELGWDGGLRDVKCLPAPLAQARQAGQMSNVKCQEDYLFIAEANVGVNKANFGLSRSAQLELSLNSDKLLHNLTISYVNQNPKGKIDLGYKNYLRLYSPLSSAVISASLVNPANGQSVNLAPDFSQEHGKNVAGMLILVPAGETRQLLISWQNSLQMTDRGSLVFLWQKQYGVVEDPVTLKIRYPDNFRVTLFPPSSLTESNAVGYNTLLRSDVQFSAIWQVQTE
ncbi:DUF4012 domain-containing protein [Candidatus Microgenomates bacterium]|nr:DUF4012 domain-containing protein [Candidatus Microgenomates bacterium]